MSELKKNKIKQKRNPKYWFHIKWNIVKTMNVNVKNPTKPYSAPPYIQEKTDKRVSSFLSEYYKNLIHVYRAQRIWDVWSYRGREGTSRFFTSGSEVRDHHKVRVGLS